MTVICQSNWSNWSRKPEFRVNMSHFWREASLRNCNLDLLLEILSAWCLKTWHFSANLYKYSLNSAIGNHFDGKALSRKVIIKREDKSSFTGGDKICQFYPRNLSKSDLFFCNLLNVSCFYHLFLYSRDLRQKVTGCWMEPHFGLKNFGWEFVIEMMGASESTAP